MYKSKFVLVLTCTKLKGKERNTVCPLANWTLAYIAIACIFTLVMPKNMSLLCYTLIPKKC